MEDYIFIIIAIVLSAIGALNRNKKKKIRQMNNEEEQVRQPSIFDQFFDDPVFNEDQKPTVIPVEEPKITPGKEELKRKPLQVSPLTAGSRPELKRDTLKVSPLSAGSIPELKKRTMRVSTLRTGSIPERRKIKTSFSNEEEVETTGESIINDFSLKKAVVYSEILNMKY